MEDCKLRVKYGLLFKWKRTGTVAMCVDECMVLGHKQNPNKKLRPKQTKHGKNTTHTQDINPWPNNKREHKTDQNHVGRTDSKNR